MEDLQKYHGKRFRAKIDGVVCEGRISVYRDSLFFCQNKKHNMTASNKMGFTCSWVVFAASCYKSIEEAIEGTYVSDLELLDDAVEFIEITHFLTI